VHIPVTGFKVETFRIIIRMAFPLGFHGGDKAPEPEGTVYKPGRGGSGSGNADDPFSRFGKVP
jgi:hypothetical protein